MGVGQRQKQVREYRGQIPSPGRPTVAWREDRVRFWASIADGVKTEDAAVEAGVSSPVAFRWFRHAGGVNPGLAATVSGRYLSSAEREDIALWRAQQVGVREIARRLDRSPSTISRELRRNASTRTYRLDYKASIAQWHAERRAPVHRPTQPAHRAHGAGAVGAGLSVPGGMGAGAGDFGRLNIAPRSSAAVHHMSTSRGTHLPSMSSSSVSEPARRRIVRAAGGVSRASTASKSAASCVVICHPPCTYPF